MKKRRVCFTGFVAAVLFLVFAVPQASAVVWLMDGKLTLSGNVRETMFVRKHYPRQEKQFHKSNVDYMRTSALIEALYKIKESQDVTINFFGGLYYYYEKAPWFDSDLKRGMPHRMYKDYKTPEDKDILTEAYIDIIKDPYQLTIGKQIVIWGETGIQRTADVVNPLDLRLGTPGVDDWESIKKALWMIRLQYQSKLPGNLLLETIFVPGDYRSFQVPNEGSHFGPPPQSFAPGQGFGVPHWVFEKNRRDAPGWNLRDNWELGFRLRGYTWDIDWTLLYYNSRMDWGVARPGPYEELAAQYLTAGIRALDTGEHINPGDWPHKRVYRRPRYQVIGGTAQTMIDSLHASTWTFEWVLDLNSSYNKALNGDTQELPYDIVRRKSFACGLVYSDYWKLPFAHKLFDDKKLSMSLTFFYDKVFNYDRDLVLGGSRSHRVGESSTWNISYSFQQFFWKQKGMLMLLGNYFPFNKYLLIPMFAYMPDDHWRFDFAWVDYGDPSHNASADKDSLLVRIRFEW